MPSTLPHAGSNAPSPTAPSPLPTHIERLDVARALAFLSVFAYHATSGFPQLHVPWHGQRPDYSIWPRDLLFLLPVSYGWLGVTLFFVLSGFCIHYATLRRPAAFSVRDFYWRRILRIYPAYLVCVAVVTLLAPLLPYAYFNVWQVLAHVAMVHNFLNATFMGLNSPLWSLAVEMQFYLLYPLLLIMLGRKIGLDRCLCLALGLNLILAVSFWVGHPGQLNPVQTKWSFPLVTWCDWILGACLAEAYTQRRRLFPRENLWLLFSGAMLAVALNFRIMNAQAYLFGSVFFAVLLQRYLFITSPLRWYERALIPVGLISYSLYLWHQPLLFLVNRWGEHGHFWSTPTGQALFVLPVTTVALGLVATLSYRLLEVGAPKAIRDFSAKRRPDAKPLPLPGPAADSP